ncbi:MAG: 2-oxo-4-hydroxy-4-carboxy-5-ureidoimidazoline decarboxylase, partial [Burkholderiaceae bacterium]
MLSDIQQLNAADRDQFVQLLGGIYEHSPWVAEQTWAARPFSSLVHLTQSLSDTVARADNNRKLELLRAHPELAGKVTPGHALTGESADEQTRAGLANCSPDELTRIRRLNTAYREKFGFPFILAVRGPRGDGLSRQEILATFERRLNNPRDFELEECLRNVNRIAQLRLNDAFHLDLEHGNLVLDWAEQLASFSESPYKERGELTVTYLTQAHRACADQLACWMREDCGFDDVHLDAVGNLVGIYRGSDPDQPRLLTGSHYDTVRNAGKYDGRLGILAPMAWVRHLHQQAKRPPFGIEVICFAEEEGQRYNATFLGSSALTGHFDPAWLMQHDLEGISMRQAMLNAGFNPDDIAALKRDPSQYLGFVEIHIEQGPVLNTAWIPLGVVTSINGSRRFTGQINGTASHAGTTPMNQRRDALVAAAELIVAVESRAASTSGT